MPRIRTIKPEFWTSEQVAECSTNARLLFIGLWTFSDDAGRHPNKPRQIKMEVFPGDPFDVDEVRAWLDELIAAGLLVAYVVDGEGYLQITGWNHQRIDKPQKPRYPGLDSANGPGTPQDLCAGVLREHSTNGPGTLPPDTIRSDTKGKDRSASLRLARGAARDEREIPDTLPDGEVPLAHGNWAAWLVSEGGWSIDRVHAVNVAQMLRQWVADSVTIGEARDAIAAAHAKQPQPASPAFYRGFVAEIVATRGQPPGAPAHAAHRPNGQTRPISALDRVIEATGTRLPGE
ncbi:MAG: hypothetical protein ACPGVG_19480 [Mycobacterium sp.]